MTRCGICGTLAPHDYCTACEDAHCDCGLGDHVHDWLCGCVEADESESLAVLPEARCPRCGEWVATLAGHPIAHCRREGGRAVLCAGVTS